MSGSARTRLGALLWLSLGGWVGAMLLFSVAVAPAAFQVLPTPELAGELVRRVLAGLNLAGATLALALAVLGALLRRGALSMLLPLALAAVCLVSHFGVSPALSEVPSLAAADPAAARRFATLHRLSVVLFAATLCGALLLAVVHVRAEGREGPPRGRAGPVSSPAPPRL